MIKWLDFSASLWFKIVFSNETWPLEKNEKGQRMGDWVDSSTYYFAWINNHRIWNVCGKHETTNLCSLRILVQKNQLTVIKRVSELIINNCMICRGKISKCALSDTWIFLRILKFIKVRCRCNRILMNNK